MTSKFMEMASKVEKLLKVVTEREAREFLRARCNLPTSELSTYVRFGKTLKGSEAAMARRSPPSLQGKFSIPVSAERVDTFDDVDILMTYGDQPFIDAMKANPLLSRMPAVARGAVVALVRNPIGTSANPTPLSISWVLKDDVALLSQAANKAQVSPFSWRC